MLGLRVLLGKRAREALPLRVDRAFGGIRRARLAFGTAVKAFEADAG